MTKPQLLVVDDEPALANLVGEVGELAGFEIYVTNSALEFQEIWASCKPDVVIMDLVMPDIEGVELLSWLAERNCCAPIILMSGYDGRYLEVAREFGVAIGNKIFGDLTKPFMIDDLEKMLKDALQAPG